MSITDPHDSSSSDHTGVRAWIKRNPLTALVLSAAVSLIVGLLIGSWATCGPRCGFDSTLFGAIGTWVGGLGTIGAFLFTAHELVVSRRREEKLDERQAKEALIEARQIVCHVETIPGTQLHYDASEMVRSELLIVWTVRNDADFPMTHLRALSLSGKEIARHEKLKGGGPLAAGSLWTVYIDPLDLGVENDLEKGEFPSHVSAKIRLEFTVRNHRFQWHNGRITLLKRLET